MAFDLHTLRRVQQDSHPPVLRFFRWSRPTVSYGKHHRLQQVIAQIPPGWDTVQRPTGGGLVLHDQDLCLSLCWRMGESAIPDRASELYAWIHGALRQALQTFLPARLATGGECSQDTSFVARECFSHPVAFDVMHGNKKIIGGALCRQKRVFLYQGSIQSIMHSDLEEHLRTFFQVSLNSPKGNLPSIHP